MKVINEKNGSSHIGWAITLVYLPTYLPTLTAFDIVPMPRAFKANKS